MSTVRYLFLFFTMLCIFFSLLDHSHRASAVRILKFGCVSNQFFGANIKDVELALNIWGNKLVKKRASEYEMKLVIYDDLTALTEAAEKKELGLASLYSMDYFKIEKKVAFEPLLVTSVSDEMYEKFILLVHQDSKINDFKSLKGKKLVVSVGGKGELNTIWLDTVLMKKKLPVSKDLFGSIKKVDSPSKAVHPVYFGQMDACLVNIGGFEAAREMNPQVGKKLRVMAESPGLLLGVVVGRKDLEADLKKDFVTIACDLENEPEGKQLLMLTRVSRFKKFDPEYLDSVRDLLREYHTLYRKSP